MTTALYRPPAASVADVAPVTWLTGKPSIFYNDDDNNN